MSSHYMVGDKIPDYLGIFNAHGNGKGPPMPTPPRRQEEPSPDDTPLRRGDPVRLRGTNIHGRVIGFRGNQVVWKSGDFVPMRDLPELLEKLPSHKVH